LHGEIGPGGFDPVAAGVTIEPEKFAVGSGDAVDALFYVTACQIQQARRWPSDR